MADCASPTCPHPDALHCLCVHVSSSSMILMCLQKHYRTNDLCLITEYFLFIFLPDRYIDLPIILAIVSPSQMYQCLHLLLCTDMKTSLYYILLFSYSYLKESLCLNCKIPNLNYISLSSGIENDTLGIHCHFCSIHVLYEILESDFYTSQYTYWHESS